MKNKNSVIGYQVEIKPAGEKFYIEFVGFYLTKEEAEAQKKACIPLLLDGDKIHIRKVAL